MMVQRNRCQENQEQWHQLGAAEHVQPSRRLLIIFLKRVSRAPKRNGSVRPGARESRRHSTRRYLPRRSRALARRLFEPHLRQRTARLAFRALQDMQIFLLKSRASASGKRAMRPRRQGGYYIFRANPKGYI